MRPNQPNRTPFDNSLVDDPDAPRHTQPLPSSPQRPQPASSQRSGPQPGGSQPVAGRPRSLPPQVVARGRHNDDDDDLYSRQPRQRQGLPTPTVIGVAMVIGALVVILVSTVVSRVLPRPQAPPLRPQNVPAPGLVTPKKKVVAETPVEEARPGAGKTAAEPAAADAPAADAPSAVAVPSADEGEDQSALRSGADEGETIAGDEAGDDEDLPQAGERLAAGDGRAPARARDREPESDGANRRSAEERNRDAQPAREEPARTEQGRGGRHFVSERSGYAIKPPAGFTLRQSGRRTVWRGPGGAQLLVETASVGGRSPRDDWERMDRGFRKKYGSRYRSHGIYETTLAGRPAAVWEFEIGATRKIDVAVHHRGTGYAVLGSAPAARFEQMRPEIEAAIRSFQLPANGQRRRETRQDEGSDATGY